LRLMGNKADVVKGLAKRCRSTAGYESRRRANDR